MSTTDYTKLDGLILETIGSARTGIHFLFLNRGNVRTECERLEKEWTGSEREAFRFLDGRLQALKRQGKINFTSKHGWKLASK